MQIFVNGVNANVSSFPFAKKAAPKNPQAQVPVRQKIIQVIEMRRAFGITRIERVAMKRTRILKQRKNSVLVMTGTGEDMELIKARVIAAGISDRVIFTGQRSDADKLYSAFDCFLLPSNYEGLPVVGVEAQCAGLHCLFSNKVTPEARITSTAQLLPLGNPGDWACAALCCAGLRSRDAAAEVAEAGYDINNAAGDLQNYYLRKSKL